MQKMLHFICCKMKNVDIELRRAKKKHAQLFRIRGDKNASSTKN